MDEFKKLSSNSSLAKISVIEDWEVYYLRTYLVKIYFKKWEKIFYFQILTKFVVKLLKSLFYIVLKDLLVYSLYF